MSNHVKISGIDCYGEMHEGQNIEVICDDEMDDGIYPDGFPNWTEAVRYLKENWNGEIVEMSAI